MSNIITTSSQFKFPYSKFNGSRMSQLTKRQCIKYAIVVGNSHYSTSFSHSQTALALASYRAMAVRCVLDFGYSDLQLRTEYSQLEASEKINLSYWIGMTFSAFAADNILGVPRLTHALKQHGLNKKRRTRSLADLVGQDSQNDWHVIEAKGRKTNPSSSQRNYFKKQAKTIGSINGKPIATASYCIGYMAKKCSIEIVDPPSGKNPLNLSISSSELGSKYYKPIIDYLNLGFTSIPYSNRTAYIKPLIYDPIDSEIVYVGLDSEVYDKAIEQQKMPFELKPFENDVLFVARDGVVIYSAKSLPCLSLL